MLRIVTRGLITAIFVVAFVTGYQYLRLQKGYSDGERQQLDQFFQNLEVPDSDSPLAPRNDTREKPEERIATLQVESLVISDGNFSTLSRGWKSSVRQLLASGGCDRFAHIIEQEVPGDESERLLATAQMIVESSCRENARSVAGARGLFQVKEVACRDVHMEGDLYDPSFNAQCAQAYRVALCTWYGWCTQADSLVAYNEGPTGARRVSDIQSHPYVRKVDYVLALLQQHSV